MSRDDWDALAEKVRIRRESDEERASKAFCSIALAVFGFKVFALLWV